MVNIFVIENAWRLINAYEAANYFQTKNNILVVLETKNKKNNTQIKKIINSDDWDDIIYISIHPRSSFIHYAISLIKLKKYKCDNLFLGWGWYPQLIFANLHFNNAYLIDDGLSAVCNYNEIINNKINYHSLFKKKLRFIFFGLKFLSFNKINFFTAYKLPSYLEHKVFINNMEALLRGHDLSSFNPTEEIYIIGQPMAEKGMVSEKDYESFVEKICINFGEKNIIYIPHRDEKIDRIKGLGLNNMTIKDLNGPIEQYFLKNNLVPSIVIGFFSSALANLDFIFQKNTKCFFCKIPDECLINEYKETIIQTVEYFKYTNVNTLELK
jgi:hypothetical protein